MVYRLLFYVGLEDVSMTFNPTRGPHVASCDPKQENFKLKLIHSPNGKDDRVEHVDENLTPRAV